mgnify:CR=1 FL=1
MAYTTINNGSLFMNTKLYTGTGSSNAITGVGFQPDWTWIKNRSQANSNHRITDAVRGVTKEIYSDLTAAEATNTNGLTAFGSDGFTVGSNGDYNNNGSAIASWNWKANGSGSANTDGDINSTVSANTTSGFSIVKYTGNATVSTIGHGLGVAPKMIITKNLSRSDAWPVDCRQGNSGAGGIMYLNETGTLGAYGNTSPYPSTAPTSTVYSVGTAGNTNYSGSNLIAYCFAEKTGFSKFGQYSGNSSNDGTFVYTGFKPALIIFKRADTGTGNWVMQDNKRSSSGGFNQNQYTLYSNTSSDEITDESAVDFLSNGFKFRNAITDNNANGSKYIYMAFAEAPLVGTNNIPANAR